jgi:shikimate kinase
VSAVKKNLVLVGMMGVGKTTIGRILAKNQNKEFIDTDEYIEKKNSMSVSEFFEKKGEKFFRMEERKEILNLLKKNDCIIALGGGAFIDEILRKNILENCISVWLDADVKILNKRSLWNKNRPLLQKENNTEKLKEIYTQRKSIYELANYKIKCDKLNKNDIVKKISELYEKY